MLTPFAAFLCVGALARNGDWAHVDAVRATGFERVAEGAPRAFTVVKSANGYVMHCTRDIDGQLDGMLRTEVGNSTGIYTWLAGNPRFVLKMDYSAAPEFIESLLPVRFSRSEVTSGSDDLERLTGKHVREAGLDTVASRDCYVLSLSDRTTLVQDLWVDQSTGMSLRQVDKVADQDIYERRLTSLELDPPVSESDFSIPEGAVVIKGEVSPQILTGATHQRSYSQYDVDLDALRARTSIEQGRWIKKALVPPNLSYMATTLHEDAKSDPVLYAYAQFDQGSQNYGMPQFGGIPAGWTEPGQVAIFGGRVYFGFPAVPDQFARGAFSDSGLGGYLQAAPLAYMGPDGSIYRVPQAEPAAAAPVPESDQTEAMARSEFLDLKTGDTLTFVQLRNLPLKSAFPDLRLPGPEPITSSKYGAMSAYEIGGAVPMKAIQWRGEDGTDYILVSTQLGYEALKLIAEKG